MSGDAYAGVAGLYDPATALFLDPVRRLVAGTLRRLGARRVCDVCCGTGRLVAQLRSAGFAAAGIDASPAMLARARALCPGRQVFARMDARRLALPGGACDATVTTFALHENTLDDRRAMLAEMFRVTRPDGHVLVVDYLAGLPASPMGLLVALAERLAGREHYRNYRDFLARKGVAGLFQAAGRPVAARHPCLGGRAALVVAPAGQAVAPACAPVRP
ncbi:class I SAM-dependent methyltransferase [Solidesulfovibrio sp.]|uniref:class I SAM-dependent methyltransferase n=1 Tax=Solidesulfovibrio sp. TaxID=2910990 RepID=UPI002B21EEFE|nr:class I SAM-dependent methyltransferase [Solidesulfovibrio sp.]MEA5090405.1 class I SAM-dependent methyltransferase [Solidesulfovibrio sp.]